MVPATHTLSPAPLTYPFPPPPDLPLSHESYAGRATKGPGAVRRHLGGRGPFAPVYLPSLTFSLCALK